MKKMVVFSMRVAGYLMFLGYQLKGIDKNKKCPEMNVFIFDDTEELRKSIGQYDEHLKSKL